MGKLPYKIYKLCKKHNKRCVVISGSIETDKVGDIAIPLADSDTDIDEAINNAQTVLAKKVEINLEKILK